MQSFAVDIGEDGHRFDAHLAAGANDADGNFAAIGDEHSFEHGLCLKSDCQTAGGTRYHVFCGSKGGKWAVKRSHPQKNGLYYIGHDDEEGKRHSLL